MLCCIISHEVDFIVKNYRNMVVFALTLIRHGETAHNKDNVIQGQMDVPLSQTGLRQAELLGCYLQYQQYTHIYASDLTRAMQTADSIIRQNKSPKATLLHDRRLRERKFGIVEGKSFKFLREVAEKSNQKAGQYTPPGGETIQQVHERAVSFFLDLCEMVKEHSFKLESQNDPAKNNSNGSTHIENGKQIGQKRKWEYNESDKIQKTEYQDIYNGKICVKELQESDENASSLESQSCSYKKDDNTLDEKVALDVHGDIDKVCFHVDNDGSCRESSSSAHIKHENLSDRAQFSVTFTDDLIRSQIMSCRSDIPNIECPNVSLSPLMDQNFITSAFLSNQLWHENSHSNPQHERRLSVCSSCDDADSGPTLIANILVVSHGGWLRELFRYFVEDLECSVPGGKKQALRISPNAGLSKFTISLEDQDGHPKIICLQIHDKQHLTSASYFDQSLNPDDIAL